MSLIRFKNSALPSLVESFFNREASELFEPFKSQVVPPVNIAENGDGYMIEVAAPGLKKENFQANLNQNVLSISYQEDENKEDNPVNYTRREFHLGAFKRSFTLPQTIDSENISANYENGVMRFFLPKREEAKPRPERLIEIH